MVLCILVYGFKLTRAEELAIIDSATFINAGIV